MNQMYILIKNLCLKEGISIAEMSRRVGIRQGLISDLKSGHSQSLKVENLSKIANYFKVPIDYFTDDADSYRHGPPPKQTPTITDDDLMFALFGDVKDELTKEDLDDVRAYAEFVMKRKLAAQQNKED